MILVDSVRVLLLLCAALCNWWAFCVSGWFGSVGVLAGSLGPAVWLAPLP